MIALDTNIITGLWLEHDPFSFKAQKALEQAHQTHALVISPVVYAELLATPHKTRLWLDNFLDDVGIRIEWELSETVWLEAGQAFATYAEPRRNQGKEQPRRLLADFVIAAHARQVGILLTADTWYKTTFPNLNLSVVK